MTVFEILKPFAAQLEQKTIQHYNAYWATDPDGIAKSWINVISRILEASGYRIIKLPKLPAAVAEKLPDNVIQFRRKK